MLQAATQEPRQSVRVSLDVYVNKIVGDEPYMVRVKDLSPEGMFVYDLIEPTLLESTRVGLEFMLPHSTEVIWAVGEVVRKEERHRADGMAIRFEYIAKIHRDLIRDYVENVDIMPMLRVIR